MTRNLSPDEIKTAAQTIYREWIGSANAVGGSFEAALQRAVEAGSRLSAKPRHGGLTGRQLELLNFISAYIDENGIPPSFDEMKDALGLRSKSGVHRMVVALEERGRIARLPDRARAIEVVAA